jgi:hypothetical protein
MYWIVFSLKEPQHDFPEHPYKKDSEEAREGSQFDEININCFSSIPVLTLEESLKP